MARPRVFASPSNAQLTASLQVSRRPRPAAGGDLRTPGAGCAGRCSPTSLSRYVMLGNRAVDADGVDLSWKSRCRWRSVARRPVMNTVGADLCGRPGDRMSSSLVARRTGRRQCNPNAPPGPCVPRLGGMPAGAADEEVRSAAPPLRGACACSVGVPGRDHVCARCGEDSTPRRDRSASNRTAAPVQEKAVETGVANVAAVSIVPSSLRCDDNYGLDPGQSRARNCFSNRRIALNQPVTQSDQPLVASARMRQAHAGIDPSLYTLIIPCRC